MLDRSITIRLPMDLLHRLETRVADANVSRAERGKEATNVSEAIRHMLKIGLDVSERGDEAEEWLMELFGPTLSNMVALAAADDDARRLLKKITARHKSKRTEVDPDFG